MTKTRSTSRGSPHRFGGDWTDAKLDVLAKYLKSYTTALEGKPTAAEPFRKAYIDAFAGTGTRTARETESSGATETLLFPDLAEAAPQKLLDGSAKLALQVEPRFDKYIFIERSPERCQQLEGLKTEFAALKDDIDVRQGEANEVIQKLCADPSKWKSRRAVLFLDPYGMQVEWKTIEAVAATKAIDLWLLVPLGMGMNRLAPKSGKLPESWRQRMNAFLGTADWYDEFYKVETKPTLFGDPPGSGEGVDGRDGALLQQPSEAGVRRRRRGAGRAVELVEEPAVHVLLRGGQRAREGHRAADRQPPTQAPKGGALMALGSCIEWTESTWNPVTGCNKISPGCKYCYAERMAERLQAMGQPNYKDGFTLALQPKMLELPLQWKKPQTIFVNSMSDLFHKDVPLEYIQRVFDVMRRAHWHRFQVLTKRADRLAQLSSEIDWPQNVWMGVSVENADFVDRIDDLRSTGAHVKFLSLEPLLGPLPKLKLKDIDWAIVGGESGPRARPMNPAWVTDIRDQCAKAGVAFFFKQWGGKNKKKAGRVLDGKTYDAMPDTAPTVPVARVLRAAGRSLAVVG